MRQAQQENPCCLCLQPVQRLSLSTVLVADILILSIKANSHQIDFSKPDDWCEKVQGDVLFACLGTTLKAAGSKEAQWAIDYEANLEFAKAARENGVDALVLISTSGANSASRLFYQPDEGRIGTSNYRFEFSAPYYFPPALIDSSE